MVARVAAGVSGLSVEASLALTSNLCLVAAFWALGCYLCNKPPDVVGWVVVVMGVFPTTFFFHMAYSESILLLLMIAAMYGMRRSWPVLATALIIGAATATRSVGVALLAPFAMHLWRDAPGIRQFVLRAAWVLPLACWGLVAFMAYQAWAFHDPLAFVKAPTLWHDRDPAPTFGRHLLALATLEPIRAVYTAGCPCHWSRHAPHDDPLLNLYFANPIYFLGTAALVVLGAAKRWLDRYEVVLSALLLLIPYVTVSYRMCMTSQGRYAAVVFPAYIVMGHLLSRMPRLIAIYLLACSGLLMAAYTALFTSWYPLL